MTDQMPPLDLPPDESQETTPHSAQQTAPMRPASMPEQSGMNAAVTQPMTPQAPQTTPTRTPAVSNPGTTPPPSGTRAMPAVPPQGTRAMPPVPPGGTRPMPPAPNAPRQGTQPMPVVRPGAPLPPRRSAPPPTMYQRKGQVAAMTPRDSSLYLPWWSLALMLVGVLILSFLVVVGIALLGGNANPASRDPIIVIVTAPPTPLGQTSDTGLPQAGGSQVLLGQNPPTSLDLQGPTLPAVQFTATPTTIEIGKFVIVTGSNPEQLNIRDNAGVQGTNIIERVPDGTILTIVDGPRQADGFTWWQVQSTDQRTKGWAVANYLQVASGGV